MNVIAICLHCLDMRDFHSHMRNTPFLDAFRKQSVFIPSGRAHGHNNKDSMNAEMTGQWTARYCDSTLTRDGYQPYSSGWLPPTLPEMLAGAGYEILTCQGYAGTGNAGFSVGLRETFLADEPQRLEIYRTCRPDTLEDMIDHIRTTGQSGNPFYAHVYLRPTHRPWGQVEGLCALVGQPPARGWPGDAFCARRAALEHPDEFGALRRRGLAQADAMVQQIVQVADHLDDTAVVVYSNHGEVFDHFRLNLPIRNTGENLVVGTSHGPYPYEVLYANMQMWRIPGQSPTTMRGVGRLVDFAPTVLDYAGVSHGFMDGVSMREDFQRGLFPMRQRHAESGTGACGCCLGMVREDGMKLISYTPEPLPPDQQPPEVIPNYHHLAAFDLSADPWEYADILDSPAGQDMLDWAVEKHAALKRPVESDGK